MTSSTPAAGADAPPPAGGFLAAELYGSAAQAARERRLWSTRFWHPLLPESLLPEGQVRAVELLDLPLLLSHPPGQPLRAFLNRCPHRGVALLEPVQGSTACRRLICPYHGWTYDLDGQLRAAAREQEFVEPLERGAWPLQALPVQQLGGLIWVALAADPIPLAQQLDLVLAEAGPLLERPRQLLDQRRRGLACDWKLAHDNTLDDYHVAVAHPTTLHWDQGPVRHYRHRFGRFANLLATPIPASRRNRLVSHGAGAADPDGDAAEFLTFGLPPWTHLLLWPDGRLVVLSFLPQAPDRCLMELWLLGDPLQAASANGLMEELEAFLVEDQRLVEAAQRGYGCADQGQEQTDWPGLWPFRPGPAHRLERRILHHQALYRDFLELL
ncbi:MAG: Rieske 2Fe-2S domain-containing protein [Cyanobium sp.]